MKVVEAVLLLAGSAMAGDYTTNFTCPNVTVVHSVETTGWYNECMGLKEQKNASTPALCKATCHEDMLCSVWQMVKSNDVLKCWTGSVTHDCLDGRGSEAKFESDLVAGERIQHGFIKVVATNDGYETLGLKNHKEDSGDEATLIKRCQLFCETDVTCTVWEYGDTGCWIEHLPTNPKKTVTRNSTFSKSVKGGQTLEHTCPAYVEPEGLPWPWIITGIVCGLLAIGALIYFLTQKEPKVKKTRAVKIEPKPEPEAPKPEPSVVYFVPQPTVLIPQPSVIIPQPTVQTYAPQTYMTTPMTETYVTTPLIR